MKGLGFHSGQEHTQGSQARSPALARHVQETSMCLFQINVFLSVSLSLSLLRSLSKKKRKNILRSALTKNKNQTQCYLFFSRETVHTLAD